MAEYRAEQLLPSGTANSAAAPEQCMFWVQGVVLCASLLKLHAYVLQSSSKYVADCFGSISSVLELSAFFGIKKDILAIAEDALLAIFLLLNSNIGCLLNRNIHNTFSKKRVFHISSNFEGGVKDTYSEPCSSHPFSFLFRTVAKGRWGELDGTVWLERDTNSLSSAQKVNLGTETCSVSRGNMIWDWLVRMSTDSVCLLWEQLTSQWWPHTHSWPKQSPTSHELKSGSAVSDRLM